MMDKLTEEERFLLLGKVTGTLSEDEEEALAHLFHNNPDAGAAYEQLASAKPAAPGAWRDIAGELRAQPRVLPFYKRKWAAAAMLAGVLAGAWMIWILIQRPTVHTAAKAGVELRLADGKVIDLSSRQGDIDAGALRLSNHSKALSYTLQDGSTATGNNTLTVPAGMNFRVNLPDGTEILLNAATKLEFPMSFSGRAREISIKGEAYLKVAKDAARPFIVHLPHSSVTVLGTEFNVNTYDSGVVKVSLVEGAVQVESGQGNVQLKPGFQAVCKEGAAIQQEAFNARYTLSWRDGLYYFNDATLADISRIVPRWFGIQIILEDAGLQNRRFTGVINRNRPISVFLDDLSAIAGIRATFDKDSVLHLR